jgi:enamine deaminase RidA (YjgF/YER057c/UK114 family)
MRGRDGDCGADDGMSRLSYPSRAHRRPALTSIRKAIVPDVWADFYEQTHIPAAVRVGSTLRVTGHTGENADGVFSPDVEEQVRQVFRNIGLTLVEGEAGWGDVVEINSYHVGLINQAEIVLKIAAEFLEEPFPAWTAVGVTELIFPEALIEISCVAILPAGLT